MTNFRSHRRLAMSSVAAAALALAGCTTTESEPTASTPLTSSAADSEGTKRDATAFQASDDAMTGVPTGTAPQSADASPDAALTITDMLVTSHEGFDRVTYELSGTGTPGWRADIVEAAIQQGSGHTIPMHGQGILQVLIDGSSIPSTIGVEPYSGPNPLEVENPGVVTEVQDAGVFEGTTQTLIGLSKPETPFHVYTLSDPTRLVVDVAH
ncbi:AMIN-like domain-containing (lipo)protein [Rhodococcus spongiicola]|uniref:AMIN-like domain-containing protein n=1 Tax=Rhodococcus spongiicola TaxID=2487352 RepID=A0A3S3BPD5_9NOCA|nr:hypothetical protein [Rhodococcus spongiicola]RVW06047.1 hypothetical protein EF834_00835 [Rhodococcus spongiicola]